MPAPSISAGPQPCPFCGTRPAAAIEIDVAMWAVTCDRCQAIGPLAGDESQALERWNERPAAWRHDGAHSPSS